MSMLTCLELEKRFGRTPALAGASLEIAPGEIIAVTGPSGSGKSTLLYCAAGILTPDAGKVVFDGQSLDRLSDSRRGALRREQFGFIFQFGRLVPELSCAENVALPLRLAGARRQDAKRRALEWLDYLEVGELADSTPGEISGGEGQRVAVARALVGDPRVVFADEPTGALDSINGEHVMRLLSEASRNTGAAVVLVTHEARVAAYADREVVLRDGHTREL
jgi:putative ABC transport system ATP-binding protein